MLSKCANPSCSSIFRYLHEGRLFHIHMKVSAKLVPGQGASRRDEFFWLCSECCERLTIVVDQKAGVHIEPRLSADVIRATN